MDWFVEVACLVVGVLYVIASLRKFRGYHKYLKRYKRATGTVIKVGKHGDFGKDKGKTDDETTGKSGSGSESKKRMLSFENLMLHEYLIEYNGKLLTDEEETTHTGIIDNTERVKIGTHVDIFYDDSTGEIKVEKERVREGIERLMIGVGFLLCYVMIKLAQGGIGIAL